MHEARQRPELFIWRQVGREFIKRVRIVEFALELSTVHTVGDNFMRFRTQVPENLRTRIQTVYNKL